MQYTQQLLANNIPLLYAWFTAMHTRVDVVMYSKVEHGDLLAIAEQAKAELLRIEAFANRFNPRSELSYINTKAYHEEITVSCELFAIIEECISYHQLSHHCFDITINSHNGFATGIPNISLNTENNSIRFLHPDVQLDLSGFIKGYAIRPMIKILDTEGIDNAIINIGNSSIYGRGNHPHGKGWKIAHPTDNRSCTLLNSCLTTSGNTEQTVWKTKNPQSGEAVFGKQAVSILTHDPALGEMLSTTIYIMENDEKHKLLAKFSAMEMEWN